MSNAGTVEMLFQDGDFFFLEMNTRLQVEHCVTEEISGLDLVAEQLHVAAGEPLRFTQDSIERRGHSIECRINAEDPAKRFLPSPGTITALRAPSGPGVRWDGGYESGDAISQYYDNLIGKLIVWAPDRETAIARMLRALEEFEIAGVKTTIPAHRALLATDEFQRGDAIRRSGSRTTSMPATFAADAGARALEVPARRPTPPAPLVERTVPVEVDGRRFSVKVWLPEMPAGGSPAGGPRRPKPTLSGGFGGAGAAGSGTVIAPMQGTIVKVLVEVGATVESGQALLVLEAMKMENHINAETSGTVKEIRVQPGDGVGTGDVLAIIE